MNIPAGEPVLVEPRRGVKRMAEVDIAILLKQIGDEDDNKMNLNRIFSEKIIALDLTCLSAPPDQIEKYSIVVDALHRAIIDISKNSETGLTGQSQLRTVVEVGCGDFRLHGYLSKIIPIGKLIYVDKAEELLQKNSHKLEPKIVDHVRKRLTPLHVEAYAGCAGNIQEIQRMNGITKEPIFAVLALDLIQCLSTNAFEKFITNVFGVISPSVVILTTPNSEFNEFFNIVPGGFRREEHKFEWSRVEFQAWCSKVCQLYPSYKFMIDGIGPGPPDTSSFGCSSQIVIFKKSVSDSSQNSAPVERNGQENSFKLIKQTDYPYYNDPVPLEEKIVQEFISFASMYLLSANKIEECNQDGIPSIKYPLASILSIHGMPLGLTIDHVKYALRVANFQIEEANENEWNTTYVILPVPESSQQTGYSTSDSDFDSEVDSANFSISHSIESQNFMDEEW